MHIDDDDLLNAVILAEVLSDDPPPERPPGPPAFPDDPPPPPPPSRPVGPHDFAPDPAGRGPRRSAGGSSDAGCGTLLGGCLAMVLMLVGGFTVLSWLFGGCVGLFR